MIEHQPYAGRIAAIVADANEIRDDFLVVEELLARLRTMKNTEVTGELRSAYNDTCERLDALSGKLRRRSESK